MVHGSHHTLQEIPIRRTVILFVVLWTFMIGGSLIWNLWQEHKAVLNQARSEGRALFFKDQIYRRWVALHGGVYVPVTEYTTPNPLLAAIPERDITTPSGRRLTLMNPAYMTRQVQEMTAKQYGVYGRITSLRPVRPGNKADSWETMALQAFEHGETEISAVVEMDGIPSMRFMRPFYVEKECLKCHAQQGYKVGDVRGGISVGVALDKYYALRKAQFISLGLWHLCIYLAGMIGIIFGGRLFEFRVRENEAISRNLDRDRQRIRSLLALSDFEASTEKELVDFALAEVVRLTESELGYFHFYEEDIETIRPFRWSRNAASHVDVLGTESMYPLEKVGIWADCIRTRQPVVHNDYGAATDKQQHPEGHFAFNRHMSVALMDGNRIVAISGVGNKVEPYDQGDVVQLTLFMGKAWAIIKDRRASAEIREKGEALLLFRKLIDQSYDAIFIVSTKDGRFLDANERVCERLGYQREELLTLGVQDVDVGLPTDFSWQSHVEHVRQKPSLLVESVHKRKDGSTFPVEINIRVIMQENDEYLVAAARDISERKAAEKELVEYKESLERLVEERTMKLAAQTEDLERSQTAMQDLLEDVNEAKKELEVKLAEIERMNRVFVDRELKMVELKGQIRELEETVKSLGEGCGRVVS